MHVMVVNEGNPPKKGRRKMAHKRRSSTGQFMKNPTGKRGHRKARHKKNPGSPVRHHRRRHHRRNPAGLDILGALGVLAGWKGSNAVVNLVGNAAPQVKTGPLRIAVKVGLGFVVATMGGRLVGQRMAQVAGAAAIASGLGDAVDTYVNPAVGGIFSDVPTLGGGMSDVPYLRSLNAPSATTQPRGLVNVSGPGWPNPWDRTR